MHHCCTCTRTMHSSEEKKEDANLVNEKDTFWSRDECVYTSCYCEENVWKLCERTRMEKKDMNEYFVILLSNKSKKFPIWYAKSAPSNDRPIIWDYHVIYLWINRQKPAKSWIFDLDSTLPFPCEVNEYITKSFRPNMKMKDEFKHNFRVVPCQIYLDTFYSDRKHMFVDNKWLSPPPKYPCIMCKNEKKGSNLMSHFVDITNTDIGVVYDDTFKLLQWITKPHQHK
eukprot:497782_1